MLRHRKGSYVTLVPPPASSTAMTMKSSTTPALSAHGVGGVTDGMASGLADADGDGAFTLIVETLQGSCGEGNCNNVDASWNDTQNLTFALSGGLGGGGDSRDSTARLPVYVCCTTTNYGVFTLACVRVCVRACVPA